mmetsp:Transcript_40178/g.119773  ORF Transcript_40178/g.119773 Transcript_40178/m.119773 type:complete len:242 (-) Transcript_40178:700-1425(-)
MACVHAAQAATLDMSSSAELCSYVASLPITLKRLFAAVCGLSFSFHHMLPFHKKIFSCEMGCNKWYCCTDHLVITHSFYGVLYIPSFRTLNVSIIYLSTTRCITHIFWKGYGISRRLYVYMCVSCPYVHIVTWLAAESPCEKIRQDRRTHESSYSSSVVNLQSVEVIIDRALHHLGHRIDSWDSTVHDMTVVQQKSNDKKPKNRCENKPGSSTSASLEYVSFDMIDMRLVAATISSHGICR